MKKTAGLLTALMCLGLISGSAECFAEDCAEEISDPVTVYEEITEGDEHDQFEWAEMSENVSSMTDLSDINLLQLSYLDDFLYRDIIKGDLNGDGIVDLSDLSLFSEWLLDDVEISFEQRVAADIVCQRYSQAEPDIADFATLRQIICHDYIGLEYDPNRLYVVAR